MLISSTATVTGGRSTGRIASYVPLLLALTALVLYAAACVLPIVRATLLGNQRSGMLISGIVSLWSGGDWTLAALVLLLGIVAPAAFLLCAAGAFHALAAGRSPSRREQRLAEFSFAIHQWMMPEVQTLGVVIAFTKLSHLVPSVPAVGLLCYGVAAACTLGAWRSFEKQFPSPERPVLPTHRRDSFLLALGAMFMLVPAYALPFMRVERLGHHSSDTIFTSVQKLWHQGMWGIAMIVFTASLLVPLLKLTGMAFLLASSRRHGTVNVGAARLHAWVHFVGRWSMLDIFLVAFLCGIVRFPGVATINPGPGAFAFAVACILTILSTLTFDPRCLIIQMPPQKLQT